MMDQSIESEPEDGEILDETEERTPSPGPRRSSRIKGYAHREERRRHDHHHVHTHSHDLRRHQPPQRYNNRSERSGGISRTLEYTRYLKDFVQRNKSISEKRSSVSGSRSSSNWQSRSPSPHHSKRKNHRRSSKEEVKYSHSDRREKKSKSRSSSSTVSSKEEAGEVDVDVNNAEDVEDVSADEMQDIVPSPAKSIEGEVAVVERHTPTKTPEIITLDSTDSSDEENTFAETEKVNPEIPETTLVASHEDNDSDATDIDVAEVGTDGNTATGIQKPSHKPDAVIEELINESSLHLQAHGNIVEQEEVDGGNTIEVVVINSNAPPEELQENVEEMEHDGHYVEEVSLDGSIDSIVEEEVDENFVEHVAPAGNNIVVEDIENIMEHDSPDGNDLEGEDVGNIMENGGVIIEEGEMQEAHLSDEEMETLELRNKLLADLVNRAESVKSPVPPHPDPDIARDNETLPGNVNNEEEEEEALREVLLSLITNKKAKPAEPLSDNNVDTTTKSTKEDSNPRPRPVAKRRSTEDDKRTPVNRRRNSNPSLNNKSRPRSRSRSPPPSSRRKPQPLSHKRSSIGSRRPSRDYDRPGRSRERDRRSSPLRNHRERDPVDRNSTRSTTLSPPPTHNKNDDRKTASSSATVKKLTLSTSRNSSKDNNSSISNVRDLPENDLRKHLLKKTSVGLTSPNNDPVGPALVNTHLFMEGERLLEDDGSELTIRRTVKFTDNGSEDIVTTAAPSRPWTHQPIGSLPSNNSLLLAQTVPQGQQNYGIPSLFDLPQTQNHLQNNIPILRMPFSEQTIQRTVFAGPPFFQQYHRPPPRLELPPIQHQQFQPIRMELEVSPPMIPFLEANNRCITMNDDLHNSPGNSPVKRTINPKRRPRRGARNKRKPNPKAKPNRWDNPPDSAHQSQLITSKPPLSTQEASSTSVAPPSLQVTINPNSSKEVATVKPSTSSAINPNSSKEVTTVKPSTSSVTINPPNSSTVTTVKPSNISLATPPLPKTATLVAQPNAPVVVTTEQVKGPLKSIQKSSPYASPVHSPTVSTNATLPKQGTTNNHRQLILKKPFNDAAPQPKKIFTRLIIPVREDDSTSDEMEDDVNEKMKSAEVSSSCVAEYGQQLDSNFQKSLDEFLKRAREESERKTKEKPNESTVSQKSGDVTASATEAIDSASIPVSSSSSPSVCGPTSSTIGKDPSPSTSKEPSNAKASSPRKLPKSPSKQSLEKASENTSGSKTFPPAGAVKELANVAAAPATIPKSASTSGTPTPSRPSPAKKRKIVRAATKSNQPTVTAASTSETSASTETNVSSTTSTSSTVSSTTPVPIENVLGNDKTEQSTPQRPKEIAGPSRTAILVPKKKTVIIPPKGTGNVNGIVANNNKNQAPSFSPKTPTASTSTPGSRTVAAKVVPVQPSPPSPKQIIIELKRKIIESRDKLTLSSKEKELLHCRQSCFDGLKDIHKSLQQHTRLQVYDSKLQSEIMETEKKLEALKKKKVEVNTKAASINQLIREKSKAVLPTKANCIILERQAKKLGDQIMGDRFYSVTDLFKKDIDAVVKDITTLHAGQPTNLKLQRGVIFHQVISDIDPTSTLGKGTNANTNANVIQTVPSSRPNVSTAGPSNRLPQTKVVMAKIQALQNIAINCEEGVSAEETNQRYQTTTLPTVPMKKTPDEHRFLTRHGRVSLTEEEDSVNVVNQEENDYGTSTFADSDVLTEIKSIQHWTLDRLTDIILPILPLSGFVIVTYVQ